MRNRKVYIKDSDGPVRIRGMFPEIGNDPKNPTALSDYQFRRASEYAHKRGITLAEVKASTSASTSTSASAGEKTEGK